MLDYIPATIKVLIIFVLVVLLIRKKFSLGNTFLVGSITLSLFFGLHPLATIESMISSICYPKTISLSIIVTLILILSNSMESSGQMKALLNRFQGLIINKKINIIVFPALIGLLPMPGGAVFSAPMVKAIGNDSNYSPDKLSFINYWFRHIWEYWWPLYPGVLLATLISNLNLTIFMVYMSPVTLIAVYLGFRMLKSDTTSESITQTSYQRPPLWPFLKELLPILIVIFPGLGIGFFLASIYPQLPVSMEIGLITALIASVLWVKYANEMSNQQIWKIIRNPQLLNMVYMIVAILVFKGILEDSKAVDAITKELIALKIHLVVIVVVLPFLIGVITGITIAFVGSAFPILIPLIQTIDPGGNILHYIMLALISGFAGVILSPVHLCFILSNEYFQTTMGAVYKRLLGPSLVLVVTGIVYFFILHRFF
ncbi:MAG: DUF401 family protein [Desulfobacterales bacterium]|jgi:uncharacterized protein|nr:DUF401 family protein [Desulfobacteraceae bacterium]MBT4364851.1 DUF401 family protein [Desulfobacteraceae bacterium]MBT7696603.1 DUF401 family protein [Desulfobacterales bacterium]